MAVNSLGSYSTHSRMSKSKFVLVVVCSSFIASVEVVDVEGNVKEAMSSLKAAN
jgi:hypothetical protein